MNFAISVTQKQLFEFLLYVAPVRPVFIWGPPGIGKSSIVREFAEQVGLPCVSLLGSQLAPEDLIGVLVEQRAPVKQEYYIGVTWDGFARKPVMICSDMGGIDIEEVAEKHPEHVARAHFSTFEPLQEFKFKELVASLGITGNELNQLSRIVARNAPTRSRRTSRRCGSTPSREASPPTASPRCGR